MPVTASFVYLAALLLEAAILLRAWRTGLLRRYVLFFSYIAIVWSSDLVLWICKQLYSRVYDDLYWPAQLITIVASYAVVIEIFRQALSRSPGVARFAQSLSLAVFGIAAVCVSALPGAPLTMERVIADFGRDLRYMEGALLVGLLWLFARYRIRMGRNLLGLVLGYSFWIAFNVTNLVLWYSPGNEASFIVRELIPISYLATTAIWCITLWSVQADPVLAAESQIERDYQRLAARTQAALARTSLRLGKAIRP